MHFDSRGVKRFVTIMLQAILFLSSQITAQETALIETSSWNNSFLERTNVSRYKSGDSFGETLKNIGYYLRGHKFNEYDRRYEKQSESAARNYFKHFPKPPLRSLHWEVRQYCESNITSCVEYLGKKLKFTTLKRTDDTSFIIQEQRWHRVNDVKQIEQVDMECQKMRKIDDILADPFAGPLERFQWRTTASYYMCWYAMQETPELEHFEEHCDNYAACLDNRFGPNNWDVRTNDTTAFACALYSFCPDVCCPFKHVDRLESCWNEPENPCYKSNPPGKRNCFLKPSSNIEFNDIVLDRWNVTCKCLQEGYTWNSLYGFCVDIDECEISETHDCNHKSEACLNLAGGYKCACKWGYAWNSKQRKCVTSAALEVIKIHKGLEPKNISQGFLQKILRFFGKSGSDTVYFMFSKPLMFFLCLASVLIYKK